MKKIHILIISLTLILIIIGGCTTTGKITQKQTQDIKTIKIGFIGPLTGEAASWGENSLAGAQLAIKEFNTNSKRYKIKLIIEESECKAKTAVSAFNKLVNIDKVDAIIGPLCSGAASATTDLAKNYKIPNIHIIASVPGLAEKSKYVFKVYPTDELQGSFTANYVYKNLNKKKIAIIYVNNEVGEQINKHFQEKFKELGGEIVFKTGVMQEQIDFKTEITKIKNTKADAIYLAVYPNNALVILKQMKELNLNIPKIGTDSLSGDEVISNEYAKGLSYVVPETSLSENFKEKLHQLPGYENLAITIASPYGYDAMKIIINAVTKVGTDKEKIIEELTKTKYIGVSNPLIEFNKFGGLKTARYEVKTVT